MHHVHDAIEAALFLLFCVIVFGVIYPL
jgi:hypothetical protein